MKKALNLIPIAILFLLSACTVKEEREDCPCILTIYMPESFLDDNKLLIKGWTGNETLFSDKVDIRDYPEGQEKRVPKGSVEYFACSNLSNSHLDGTRIITSKGKQADRIFAYSTSLDTSSETAYDRIFLHKQFATLHITFGKKYGNDPGISDVEIDAGYNGIDILGMRPLEGDFHYNAKAQDNGHEIRLPRQGDGRIQMKILRNSTLIDTLELDTILKENGFSWEKEDLDDIWLDFDYGRHTVTVKTEEWVGTEPYAEVI